MKKPFRRLYPALAVLLLSACQGGGGSSNPALSSPPAVQQPGQEAMLSLEPVGGLDFSNQNIGSQTPSRIVTATNAGNSAIEITAVSTDLPQFPVISAPSLPVDVDPGEVVTIEVAFAPDAGQIFDGTLTVVVEPQGSESLPLSGTGISGTFAITTDELPDATVGSPYIADIYTEFGIPPLSWSVRQGDNMPAGLSLDQAGRVSGSLLVNESPGVVQFTVEVQDSASVSQTASRTISIDKFNPTGANCDNISTGFRALPDLGADFYLGEQGGSYPDGNSFRPAAHTAGGWSQTAQIGPVDPNGNPDDSGEFVLLSIGMSNTTMEFSRFLDLSAADPELNPRMVIVDGAQSGQSAAFIANPNVPYWDFVDSRLDAAGVTPAQVQVVWMKEANANPNSGFLEYAETLRDDIGDIVRNLHDKFPNIKVAYLSNRIYGGYANTQLNPEPYAYQTGFAVKWLIEQQVQGLGNLNYDPAAGLVVSPWLDWGPDLWSDGLEPRSDRLVWTCQDVGSDGTHPAVPGRLKVANLLMDFLKRDSLTRQWFLANP